MPHVRDQQFGDLPVQGPSLFEFGINLKTAKAMGLTVPQPLLIAADEIVQYRAESAAGGPSKVRSTLAPVLKYWVA